VTCGQYNNLINFVLIAEKGNVTTYEWKNGEPPLKIELPELDYSFNGEERSVAEENPHLDLQFEAIDFGDISTAGVSVDTQVTGKPSNEGEHGAGARSGS